MFTHFLHQYLWVDFVVPVWPNLAASAVTWIYVGFKMRAHKLLLKELHSKIDGTSRVADRTAQQDGTGQPPAGSA